MFIYKGFLPKITNHLCFLLFFATVAHGMSSGMADTAFSFIKKHEKLAATALIGAGLVVGLGTYVYNSRQTYNEKESVFQGLIGAAWGDLLDVTQFAPESSESHAVAYYAAMASQHKTDQLAAIVKDFKKAYNTAIRNEPALIRYQLLKIQYLRLRYELNAILEALVCFPIQAIGGDAPLFISPYNTP